MNQQKKEELKKEFKKKFVIKCSDGELIADFKDGKILKPSQIFDFFMSQFDTIMNEKIEKLAELEHEQWMEWSKAIAGSENISKDRLERWGKCWKPYNELNENQKDQDRVYARKVITILKE